MAATQAQRAALYATLVNSMGEEAADTLMDQLPPSGWDQMATKEDLAGVELRFQAALTAGFAEINAKLAERCAGLAESQAEGYAKLAESHAKLAESQAEGFAKLVERDEKLAERQAEGYAKLVEGQASLWVALHEGFAEAAKERAEIIKSQAKQLYVIVATIAAATVSIWIAVFTSAPGG